MNRAFTREGFAIACILGRMEIFTPTRFLQNNLNSICLRILARSISIICIVNKIQATHIVYSSLVSVFWFYIH